MSPIVCCCAPLLFRRQYEQDSYDKLIKTIEGQDLLPQVQAVRCTGWCQCPKGLWWCAPGLQSWAIPCCPLSTAALCSFTDEPRLCLLDTLAGRVQDAAEEDLQAAEVRRQNKSLSWAALKAGRRAAAVCRPHIAICTPHLVFYSTCAEPLDTAACVFAHR